MPPRGAVRIGDTPPRKDLLPALYAPHMSRQSFPPRDFTLYDARGDILVGSADQAPVRLARGARGSHLSVVGTAPGDDLGYTPIQPLVDNFVESGCVISADSVGVNRNYSVSAGVVWINGNRLTVPASAGQTATASNDTYIDLIDNGDGTVAYTRPAVANNAASPALSAPGTTAEVLRLGIVVAGATTIAAATSINQGELDRVLPLVSSIPLSVSDSLGNMIHPSSPSRRLLSYRQRITNFTTTTIGAPVTIPELQSAFIVPPGAPRWVRYFFSFRRFSSSVATAQQLTTEILNVAAILAFNESQSVAANSTRPQPTTALELLAAGSYTRICAVQHAIAGTLTVTAGAATPTYMTVELL